MAVFSFQLPVTSPLRVISLRELNGHDELMTDDIGTPGILKLLNSIIVHSPYTGNQPVIAEKIAISDRDYLLAGIYKYTYSPRIQSTLDCISCGEKYDVDFLLDDLVAHMRSSSINIEKDQEGFFSLDAGSRFRLPNGEDELAAWGLPVEQAGHLMLQRCCLNEQVTEEKANEIQQAMEELAPVLFTDINLNCPECGHAQIVQFDMQSFLLARLKNGRKKVAAEVHCIATTYGWSHHEILELPRSLRQTYSALIGLN